MTTFYICRHGQTEYNQQERLQGWIDTPLTEQGLRNVQSAVGKLQGIHFDGVYSSDLGRAFVTSYIIVRRLGYDAEIQPTKGLRESNYGDLAGMLGRDAGARYPGLNTEADFIPPNGESLAHMQARVLACLQEISSEHPTETILLVSHDGPINAIYAEFAKTDLGRLSVDTVNPNDFVAKFTFEGGNITTYQEVAADI